MKRALISVSDKSNLFPFVRGLVACGYEIISTGGTYKQLQELGIKVTPIKEVTGVPEMLDGRVKTLHPHIHGGLLASRDSLKHLSELEEHGIQPIDLVCVNLYPFEETILKEGVTREEAIENIDIGGPSMLRSAAKNHRFVTVICDKFDYEMVLDEIKIAGDTTPETKRNLAAKVFQHTAAYDAHIAGYLTNQTDGFPQKLTITYERNQPLRYGENPHQMAAFYKRLAPVSFSLVSAKKRHGKELSYNNIQDGNAALKIVRDFDEPVVVALKHMNPCGIGLGSDVYSAFLKAYEADNVSIFGGVIASNQEIDKQTAVLLSGIFLEMILAPSYSAEAFEILSAKKNIRLLEVNMENDGELENQVVSVTGGLLIQAPDRSLLEHFNCVTMREPSIDEMRQLKFAWKAVKHVKSNAIVIAKDNMTIGIGAGQMNRVGAARIAVSTAVDKCRGGVMASDAFFPMSDTVELAARAGVTAIIQPGGSIKDQDSIDACNKHNIAMIFTGVRHFLH